MPARDPDRTQQTRGAVLAAALQVFAKQGIAATRVEDLLVAANIARRTFYKYFTSKEDVVAALYEVTTGQLVAAIREAQRRDRSTPFAGVHLGIDTYLDFHRGIRGLHEIVELGLRSDSMLAPRRRWMRDELVRVLDDAAFEHTGRRLDPLLFYALLSAVEGLSLQILQDQGTAAEIDRARVVIHALLDQLFGVPNGRALPGAPGE
jgi:AcrR family transcriptional regulator